VKQWLSWALACWVVVYLLLSLGPQAAVNYDPRTPDEARSVALGRELASASSRVSSVTTFGFHPTRAEPLESLPIHFALWSTADVDPPWWDTRGPPRCTVRILVNCKAAGQNRQRKSGGEARLLHEFLTSAHQTKKPGFCNNL
jgi:hypothetical protein